MAKAKATSERLQHFDLRMNFKLLQLANPNYFGNIKASKQKSVVSIAGNTFYEELKCVAYHPATQLLNATVQVKQANGYSGGPCGAGSFEYVRFYVDYNRNGNWVDEGFAGTNVHDLPFKDPLCYNVTLKIDPDKRSCCDDPAILPRVRAILSWNGIPPAGQPNWVPVWGNVVESNIQVAPSRSLWCLIKGGLQLEPAIKDQLVANLDKLALPLPAPPPPVPVPFPVLKKMYKGKVEDTRIVYKQAQALMLDSSLAMDPTQLQVADINWADIFKGLQQLKFNTTYEEVKCVALNRELDALHASVVIKRPAGYSGAMCTAGSKEHVAFYMDFGSGYQYMGQSSVVVHDIPTIPNDGLWYDVSLPVNLEPHQKEWCASGQAKVKAILSWNTPLPVNQPNYIAPYGDWEECMVEIKSLPKGVQPGVTVLSLESVGGMAINKINNATGLANGTSVGGGFAANDSPFDGRVNINGLIFFPGTASYEYRIMLRRPAEADFYPVTNKVTLQTNTLGVISADIDLMPASDGWMPYLAVPGVKTIVNNYLGMVAPASNGLHSVYLQVRNLATSVVINSDVVTFLADKDAPTANIDIDGGNCKTFGKGTSLTGVFSMYDTYARSLSLSLHPVTAAGSTDPEVTAPVTGVHSMSYGVNLPGSGTAGTWKMPTTGLQPCGYVVRIDVYDRTIINSSHIGHHNFDEEGFCLV